jgi:cell division topological specificity factor
MKLLDLFRKQPASAPAARERLQILLAHERAGREGAADFLPQLQKELLQVVKKYVQIDDDKVQVQLDREGDVATLEVNVELPDDVPQKRSA